eukprot:Ihof_evm1s569 gene=Ihof_evmTU1s569
MDAQRLLLDELMGKGRNTTTGEVVKLHWSDPQVCKYFLCGFCPHDLFTNTKNDLGPCNNEHDEKLRTEYSNSRRVGTYGYEEDLIRYLGSIIRPLDRKIAQALQRISPQGVQGEGKTAYAALNTRIEQLTNQINTLGEEGKVDAAQAIMVQVDQLRAEQLKLMGGENPLDKRTVVCMICGAMLGEEEAQSRVDAHLQGKTHLGYVKIRKTLKEYN